MFQIAQLIITFEKLSLSSSISLLLRGKYDDLLIIDSNTNWWVLFIGYIMNDIYVMGSICILLFSAWDNRLSYAFDHSISTDNYNLVDT